MAINGDGYFIVQKPTSFTGNTPIFGGVDSYTRRGDFELNANGYLVNGAGYYLEGIPIDPTTGNPTGNVAAPLQFHNNFLPANATTQINYGINLPATPSTPSYNSATPNSELLNPANFTHRPHSRRNRTGHRQRRINFRQRIGRWRVGHGLRRGRNAGQSSAQMGQDRQRRQRRHRYLGTVLSDRCKRNRHASRLAKCRHRFHLQLGRTTNRTYQQYGAQWC